ncbi:SDR family NAD(P)-dependent oxidoreductase [Dermabacter vaginalis]|uniref:SDR family NAD(P)-dependent oxidoreductase n=2 Tax=Dermabacter vaginalis TaxID=1630135 RepID=A0ABX6A4M1_9MICO|nr:SDR family NAD(P)-dependent oxidoreductase [Dermabacter vaginalis]
MKGAQIMGKNLSSPRGLRGKVAFITGASGALGSDAARALHARGVRLALLGRNTDKLESLARELGGPANALAIDMNVRNLASVEAAAKSAAEHFGGIDIVVAGAGMVTTELAENYSATGFVDDIDTNLNGVWRTIKATLPYVRESKGHICIIASLASFIHMPEMSAYSASKAGVLALANSLRLELDGSSVTVGTIHPSFFESALGDALTTSPLLNRASGNFGGLFAPIKREDVVSAIVKNIERRSRVAVLPWAFSALALVPGLGQRVIEPYLTHNLRKTAQKLSH